MVTTQLCYICSRPIGNVNISEHHLIPKEYKGTDTILLHNVCHKKIHSVFTNYELAHTYHTVEVIVEHPEIQKFVKWVSNKPLNFNDKVIETNHRYGKRRHK